MRSPLSAFLLTTAVLLAACGNSESTHADDPAAPAGEGSAGSESATQAVETSAESDFYSLRALSLEGEPVDLSQYRGQVALVVNVASRCGYTPQYAGLQRIYQENMDRGLAVLAFPSNDFGGQEPGTAEQIREFCTESYGVDFPMFAKVQTKVGAGQSPVYAFLGQASGQLPKWNFGKYLIGKDGRVLGYYGSSVNPDSAELRAAIDAALQ